MTNATTVTIEPHVLLTDWRVKPFNRFYAFNETQQCWPIDQKPVLKELMSHQDSDHDKNYHVYISSQMRQSAKTVDNHRRQIRIQDIEPGFVDVVGEVGRGKRYVEPFLSRQYDTQRSMDKDWLTYTSECPSCPDRFQHRLFGGDAF